MERREFIGGAVLAGVAGMTPGQTTVASAGTLTEPNHMTASSSRHRGRFKLKYAPHFGMFRNHGGEDHVGQLEFMADEGFVALEDNGMKGRPVETQQRVASAMTRLGMEMGVFVAHADFGNVTFASDDSAMTDKLVKLMRESVETAKRVNAKWCTVVPGAYHGKLQWDYQTRNVIENLKRCSEVCEPAGLTMVLEPLNPYRDHPGLFLTKIPQAYMICQAVGSPSCKILDDLYHQQITEGNLIPNLERSWDEIAYFQVGDNPGRKEPTTGEINFRNVFKRIHEKGFDGIVGMEHGNSRGGKDGERTVIDAYAWSDDF